MTRSRWFKFAVVLALVFALVPVAAAQQERRKKDKKKNRGKKKKPAVVALAVQVDVDADLVAMYEGAQYDELVAAVEEVKAPDVVVSPDALFFEVLAHERRGATQQAGGVCEELSARPDTDAWHYIGASAAALLAGNLDQALVDVDAAIGLDAGNKYAHFQRGRVLVRRQDYKISVASFVRVLEIDGAFAYGHYWAGFSYNKTKNLVSMTNHFERFIQLAPDAPERGQVAAILAAMQ